MRDARRLISYEVFWLLGLLRDRDPKPISGPAWLVATSGGFKTQWSAHVYQWSAHAYQWSTHAYQWSAHAYQWSAHVYQCSIWRLLLL